ncbi:MAG: TonB-dependent receptor [Pseudomonadota bacterium]
MTSRNQATHSRCSLSNTPLLVALFIAVAGLWSNAAAQEKRYPFAIPSGPLSAALNEIARTTDATLSYTPALVAGRETAGVTGSFSVEDALQQLLAGTGLTYQDVGGGQLVLQEVSGPRSDAVVLDPIVVQGELQTRTLQDTLTSVAVISGEELEGRSDSSVFDVIERTAGASLGSGGEQAVFRGVPAGGLGGGAPVITTTIDGARVESGRFSFNALQSTWDLEQIEILRGPQSTQSGRNALAGAIVLRSADPVHELEMKARALAGNGSTLEGAFTANVPVIEDTLALRVSLDREQTDGFVTNTTLGTDDIDNRADTTLRTSVLLEPTENFSGIFKYTRIESDSSANGPPLQGSLFPDSRVNVASVPEREVATFNAGNLRLGYDFNDSFRVETETTLSKSNTVTVTDLDFTAAQIGVFVNDQDVQALEQEIKLLYQSDRINAVFGGFFAQQETDFRSDSTVPAFLFDPTLPPTLTLSTVQESESEQTNYAVFGEAEIEVFPDIDLILGARYDRQTNKDSQVTDIVPSDPSFPPVFPSSSAAGEATFDAFLPKVGLSYAITEDVTIGATAQRAYRAGGVSISRLTGVQQDFDPEFAWTYELSLRSQWWDDLLTVNANAFYTDWQDQQIAVPGLNPLDLFTENAGTSRLFGGEIDITVQPTDDLSLFAAFGYADTEFRDFVLNGVQQAGNEFPFASKFTAAFGGTYFFYQDAFVSADASYQSSAFSDVENTPSREIEGRFLVNARVGYDAENWSVTAFAANLFDNDYITSIQDPAFGTQGLISAGAPRTFGVIGQINF